MRLGVFSLKFRKHFENKVWYDGIKFKLIQNGIPGNLLKLLRNFLSDRGKRVVLNGHVTTWRNVTPGVPQGFIFSPLLS